MQVQEPIPVVVEETGDGHALEVCYFFFSTSISDNTSSSQTPQSGMIIDWAADDDAGIPSIDSLQAEFGASGSVTFEFGAAGVLMLRMKVKSR